MSWRRNGYRPVTTTHTYGNVLDRTDPGWADRLSRPDLSCHRAERPREGRGRPLIEEMKQRRKRESE
ncbi:hypothetical protein HSR122_3058 [Halapricum desulfuricans]|uniref:Uncharacterized protein n=1 Tax=Halapricum desulfuricans TaxID=2841257 RepID=A0A897NJH7_9EURY|nr:hypothetical protein HSR122_3058 [Halapricum desulfuricans]